MKTKLFLDPLSRVPGFQSATSPSSLLRINTNRRLKAGGLAALLLATGLSARAGMFTWSAPAPITTADTTLAQSGTVVGGAVFGSREVVVVLSNSTAIDFKADGSVATANGDGTTFGANTNSTGNTDFNTVLTQFNYDGGPKTITLNNLTVGVQYSVQLFALDDRGGGISARRANFQDPADAANVSATFTMGGNVYVVGTFTANAATVTIQENLLDGNAGNINALVIRQLSNLPAAPQIVTQPEPATIYNGQTARLNVIAYGTALSYRWQKSAVGAGVFTDVANGGRISGATSSTLVISNLAAGDAGDYQVVVSNSANSVVSIPVTLTVQAGTPLFTWAAPVAISSADATLNLTGTVVGAAVFGTTERIVTLTNSAVIDFKADGSVAAVTGGGIGTASGAFSGNTGNANFDATLTQFNYDGGPKIITLNNLIVGQQYSVQLFALDNRGGLSSLLRASFQDVNDPVDVSATFTMGDSVYVVGTFTANSSSISIQENLPDNNGGGNINALVIRALGVLVAPQITSQPQPVTIDQGLNTSFTVAASGSAPFAYLWQRGPVGSGVFTNVPSSSRISGQTSSTLTITNLSVNDSADYQVIVVNAVGSVTSTPPATLSVQAVVPQFLWANPVAITSADATLNQNGSVVGAVVFGNTPKIVVLSNGTSVDFKNDGSVATATGGGTFTGAFSGNTGNANFNAVLNQASYESGFNPIDPTKTITLNNLVAGQQYSVQLFALDDRNGASTRSVNFQDPADANDYSTPFYMPDNVFTMGTFTASGSSVSIQENLFGSGGNINALVVRRLSGLPVAPQITTQPQGKTVYAGTPVQLTVGANGSSLNYQWQRGAIGSGIYSNVNNGAGIFGATTAQLTLSNPSANDTADYRVVISNGAGSATSNPAATLTVIPSSPAALTHRWAFNETSGTTAVDSIGGANGTLIGGGASFNNGLLVLSNPSPQTTGAGSYVSIPGGLVSGLTAVTFETWLTNSGLNNGNTLIGFGGPIDPSGNGTNFLNYFLRWPASRNGFQIHTYAGDSGVALLGTRQQNGYFHWVLTYDPVLGNVQLYLNGALVESASGITIPLNTVGTTTGYIGYSAWNQVVGTAIPTTSGNFPYYNGSLDEVRIYSGMLSTNAIAATQLLGPNQLLSDNATLNVSNNAGSLVLSWPLVNGAFALETSPVLGAGAVWTPVSGTKSVVGSNYQMTVTATNATAFFRLHQ